MADVASLGLYGLGTMGSALALNILDNGFALHVANRTPEVTERFRAEAGPLGAGLRVHDSLEAMARELPGG